jgi:hypothetical protein
MPNNPQKRKKSRTPRTPEETGLVDDPGGSPLEWLETGVPCLREAVRRAEGEPWDRLQSGIENDALTERRRRKLEQISLLVEVEIERRDSAA